MKLDEADKIRKECMAVLLKAESYSGFFPLSMLPCEKEKIKIALKVCLLIVSFKGGRRLTEEWEKGIKYCYFALADFVDDEKAKLAEEAMEGAISCAKKGARNINVEEEHYKLRPAFKAVAELTEARRKEKSKLEEEYKRFEVLLGLFNFENNVDKFSSLLKVGEWAKEYNVSFTEFWEAMKCIDNVGGERRRNESGRP